MLGKFVSEICQISSPTYRLLIPKMKFSSHNGDTDVAIIGGGIIGCSTAYWLKKESPNLRITIVERDSSYRQASTVLSVGGLRQQFSEPENIQMSLFCSHVFSNLKEYFSINGEDVDIQFMKRGYLILSSKRQSNILMSNFEIQKKCGATLSFLSKKELQNKWPWMSLDDIECGVYGTDNEGWFDPWSLLSAIKAKLNQLGIQFVNGYLKEFHSFSGEIQSATIQLNNGGETKIRCKTVVNSSGCWASNVARLAEISVGLSGKEFPIYVEKCKRYVYLLSVPDFPTNHVTPLVIDSSGVYFRKEYSSFFICGISPEQDQEPSCDNLDVDYEWFDEYIWPKLAHRVPSMGALKVKSGWAGFYDYNTKDQNLIIGRHPVIRNFYLCNGSSGHGLQHAMAIGRANMELIIHGTFRSIDLNRFNYERFLNNTLVFEKNIF